MPIEDVVAQVWRPLAGPVDDSPLVLADASSVAPDDLMPVALHRPTYSGQTYAVAHNPAHKYALQCSQLWTRRKTSS